MKNGEISPTDSARHGITTKGIEIFHSLSKEHDGRRDHRNGHDTLGHVHGTETRLQLHDVE